MADNFREHVARLSEFRRLRRRITPLLMALVLLIAQVAAAMLTPSPAYADTGGYPNDSMPCEHYPYATSGTGYWCANYDWGPKQTTVYNDPSEISGYGYAYRNCTDFVAWRLASLGVSSAQYKGLGDAKSWAANASANSLSIDTTPAAGAVAVDTTSTYGHVAYISSYNSSSKNHLDRGIQLWTRRQLRDALRHAHWPWIQQDHTFRKV